MRAAAWLHAMHCATSPLQPAALAPPSPAPCFKPPPSRSVASASVSGSQRFKIAIRPAEEAGGAAATRGGDPSALRAAAQGLRLGLGGLSSADTTPQASARSAGAAPLRLGSGVSALKPEV